MLRHVKMTLEWLRPSVRAELDAVKGGLPALKYIGYPDLIVRDILEQANVLVKFLMESSTLLMSSISVIEAGSIKDQAQEGQMTTRLALLHVPFSFVTDIFSMKTREINGSPLLMWVPVAAFLVVSSCTLGIFFLLEMEADLKVGCLRTVLDSDSQLGVWDVRGEWFGGGKASQIFPYHSHLSPGV
jgi:hypothetical protein